MNKNIQIIRQTSSLLIIVILTLLISCSEDGSITSYKNEKSVDYKKEQSPVRTTSLASFDASSDEDEGNNYYQSSFCTVRYFKKDGSYKGAHCELFNGSFFEVYQGSLTPPDDIAWGDEVTITMDCVKDPVNGELIFTFGPSGSQFDPPASLWLDWSDLGSNQAKLFLLNDDGSREEQTPDHIDVINKRMEINIHHFSRYAVAYSN